MISAANVHDSMVLEEIIDAVKHIKRPRGRPSKRPEKTLNRYGATPSTYTANFKGCTKSGTSAAETLTGTSAADIICGLGGNDTLSGGTGTDTKVTDATERSIVGFP
jgi:RTX calcium-binding nonapeptide repeat (4 copies)